MHGTMRQTITKDTVNGIVAEVKGGALRSTRIPLSKRRNVASQRRKIDGCHYGNLSMFMICSIMESDDSKSQAACIRLLGEPLSIDAGGENNRRHGAFDTFKSADLVEQFIQFLYRRCFDNNDHIELAADRM